MAVGCTRNDDSRNRVLEDELLLVAGFEDHRVLVERSDTTRQLHAADQIDRNIVPFLSCRIEEGILNILLRRLGFHLPISFFPVRGRAASIGKGNRRQLSSYWLLQYGLVKRFSTSRAIIFSADSPALGAPKANSGCLKSASAKKNRPGFISLASHLQSSVPEQSFRIGALTLTSINL